MERATAWMDPGNFDDVLQASHFIQVIEQRQGFKIGCIEEIAYRQGFIDASQLEKLAEGLTKSGYGQYLLSIIKK